MTDEDSRTRRAIVPSPKGSLVIGSSELVERGLELAARIEGHPKTIYHQWPPRYGIGTRHKGHGTWVTAFSPDGAVVAVATHAYREGRDPDILEEFAVWALPSCELVCGSGDQGLPWSSKPVQYIFCMAISAGDGFLLIGDDEGLRLLDFRQKKEMCLLRTEQPQRVELTPDCVSAIVVGDTDISVWDLRKGIRIRQFQKEGGFPCTNPVAVSADGRRLLVGGWRRELSLIDLNTGTEIHRFAGHTGVVSAAISEDGGLAMSLRRDGSIHLWDLASFSLVRQWQHGTRKPEVGPVHDCLFPVARCVRFSQDGLNALSIGGLGDNSVSVWQVATGAETHRLVKPRATVEAAFVAGTPFVATTDCDGLVGIWNLGQRWSSER